MSTPRYQDVLEQAYEGVRRSAEDVLDLELENFDSPIEKVFLATMFQFGWMPFFRTASSEVVRARDLAKQSGLLPPRDNDVSGVRARMFITYMSVADPSPICLTQARIRLESRDIRPDFAFIIGGENGAKVIVELDGHDFHERTPEQAQADKSRDRELQRMGWQVMRFTGREVLCDPAKCFFEVGTMLHAKIVSATHAAKVES